MSAFGNEEDQTIAEALQNEIREAAMVKQSLETEKRSLEAAIAMIDITPEIRSKIKEIAGKVRGKLRGKATFEQKRDLLDALDVQVKLTRDESGKRFFNIACAFSPSLVTIEYDTSSILWGEALIP